MRRLCVFCGSASGTQPEYLASARKLGKSLAAKKIELVYGGGRVGLMGAIADSVLEAGGTVIGIIPERLAAKEIAHNGLTELHVVKSMHERKAAMAEMSDGFIAMPGGFGTIEEFCEVLTWSQLGFQKKPCGLLNTLGFYNTLIELFDDMTKKEFVMKVHRDLVIVSEDPDEMIEKVSNYVHTAPDKWLTKDDL
jgi:uncharacterized protein (TIGR00730 family)